MCKAWFKLFPSISSYDLCVAVYILGGIGYILGALHAYPPILPMVYYYHFAGEEIE